MADNFNLNALIAQGPPKFDFSGLGGLANGYWEGLDQRDKREARDLFKDGLPKGPDGQLDLRKALESILQQGGAPAAAGTVPMLSQLEQLQADQKNANFRATGQDQGTSPTLPPSAGANGLQSSGGRSTPGDFGNAATIKGLLIARAQKFGWDANRVEQEAAALSAKTGIHPDDPLTDPAKRQAVVQASQALFGGSQPQGGPAMTQQQPPMAPQGGPVGGGPTPTPAPPAPMGPMGMPSFNDRFAGANAPISRPPVPATPVDDPLSPAPKGMSAQDYLRGLRQREASGTKEGRTETTKEIARVETYLRDQRAIEIEARKTEATKNVETLSKLSDDGIDARAHTGQLEVIKELGRKVGYGIVPKVQSILGHYGIETKGLSDIQAYERAIDFMSPQLRPIGSGRLLQNELNAFKSALGGLMTTPEGREISVSNLQLLSKYKEDVGRVASDESMRAGERIKAIYQIPAPKLQTEVPKAAGKPTGPSRSDIENEMRRRGLLK